MFCFSVVRNASSLKTDRFITTWKVSLLSAQILKAAFERELVLLDSCLIGAVNSTPARSDVLVNVASHLDEFAQTGDFGGLELAT